MGYGTFGVPVGDIDSTPGRSLNESYADEAAKPSSSNQSKWSSVAVHDLVKDSLNGSVFFDDSQVAERGDHQKAQVEKARSSFSFFGWITARFAGQKSVDSVNKGNRVFNSVEESSL